MGLDTTERGDGTSTADGVYVVDGAGGPGASGNGIGWTKPERPTVEITESECVAVGLRVTQDRVLIRADRDDKAPTQTASGLYVAQSLAAAVDGSDSGESWFVGTIVQLGPLVRRFDVRDVVLDWLQELEQAGHDIAPIELRVLRARIRALPKEHVDPLAVGDRVVFSWASGQQITIGEDKYVLLRMDDILGIVESE